MEQAGVSKQIMMGCRCRHAIKCTTQLSHSYQYNEHAFTEGKIVGSEEIYNIHLFKSRSKAQREGKKKKTLLK